MLGWFKQLSGTAKIASSVGAVSGAIVATAAAWPHVESVAPAHRGYVVEKVGDVRSVTNELQKWRFEDAKAKLSADSANWNIQLQREKDPNTRALIQQNIERIDREKQAVEDRLNALRGK